MPPSAKCQAPPLRDVAAQLRRLQEHPADFRLHLGIATALFAAGLRKEALATLQHAGALAARDSARWREIASVLTQAGARAPAITALQQALAIEPTPRTPPPTPPPPDTRPPPPPPPPAPPPPPRPGVLSRTDRTDRTDRIRADT